MIQQGVKPVHAVLLDVMKGDTPAGTMLWSFLDVDRIPSIPILGDVLRYAIAIMVPWHEGHVPLAALLVLCFIRKHTALAKKLRDDSVLRESVRVR